MVCLMESTAHGFRLCEIDKMCTIIIPLIGGADWFSGCSKTCTVRYIGFNYV